MTMNPPLKADFPQEVVRVLHSCDIAPGFLHISAFFFLEKVSTKPPSIAEEIGFLTHY